MAGGVLGTARSIPDVRDIELNMARSVLNMAGNDLGVAGSDLAMSRGDLEMAGSDLKKERRIWSRINGWECRMQWQ